MKTVQIVVRLPEDFLGALETYRIKWACRSRNEAIKRMIAVETQRPDPAPDPITEGIMENTNFKRIQEGLYDALSIAKGEADPASFRVHKDGKSVPEDKRYEALCVKPAPERKNLLQLGPTPSVPGSLLKTKKK